MFWFSRYFVSVLDVKYTTLIVHSFQFFLNDVGATRVSGVVFFDHILLTKQLKITVVDGPEVIFHITPFYDARK